MWGQRTSPARTTRTPSMKIPLIHSPRLPGEDSVTLSINCLINDPLKSSTHCSLEPGAASLAFSPGAQQTSFLPLLSFGRRPYLVPAALAPRAGSSSTHTLPPHTPAPCLSALPPLHLNVRLSIFLPPLFPSLFKRLCVSHPGFLWLSSLFVSFPLPTLSLCLYS